MWETQCHKPTIRVISGCLIIGFTTVSHFQRIYPNIKFFDTLTACPKAL